MTEAIVVKDVALKGRSSERLRIRELSLEPSQLIALVGPNGSGKTSLLRSILGLETELSGAITCGDLDLLRTSPRRRAAVVGWLPQHEPQAEGIDVEEFLHGACFRYQASRAALTHRIHKQLDVSGLAQLAQAPLQQLSGGERQRLGLAALMLQAPEWWLCDEPANHLDPKQQLLTYGALGRAWSDGQALICVTHDINLLWHAVPEARWEDVRVLGMNRGEIVVDEPLVSSALVEGLREIYELDVALVREAGVPRLAMTLPWEAK